MPAVSLNQDGAGGDELRHCFPSLDTPGTFCSAPIPHLLHHIPLPVLLLFLCSAVLGHQAAATSEPALGGEFGVRRGHRKGVQWSQVCDGWWSVWRCFLQHGSVWSQPNPCVPKLPQA